MDYARREVFPSSPLALVAAEIRFSDSARLRTQETIDAIAIALESTLPVQEQFQQHEVEVLPGAAAPQVRQTEGRTFKNVSSTAVATLSSDRLSLETTAYSHFPEFREQVLTCCRALVDASVTTAVKRIGLRYIDEIRVPAGEIVHVQDWTKWIDKRLLGQLMLSPADATVVQAEGTMIYSFAEGRGLNFRFAALPHGAVVSPAALMRHQVDQSLPLFVFDLDGYQDFEGPDATLLSVDVVAAALDAVHGPSGATFQASITDDARAVFRRN